MASITIRDLKPNVKQQLKALAVRNGRSMEAEARDILTRAATAPRQSRNLANSLHKRFSKYANDGFTLLPDQPADDPPSFE